MILSKMYLRLLSAEGSQVQNKYVILQFVVWYFDYDIKMILSKMYLRLLSAEGSQVQNKYVILQFVVWYFDYQIRTRDKR